MFYTSTNSSYRFHPTDFMFGQLHLKTFVIKTYQKNVDFSNHLCHGAMANFDVTP